MVQAQRCYVKNGVLLDQQQQQQQQQQLIISESDETRQQVVPSERERERERESSSSSWKKKSNAAAKNHAVAERKRRKRINSHISTLRTLLPNLSAGDKAGVLTETVLYIKQLRKTAAEQERRGCCCCTSGSCLFMLPGEKDEVQVNYIHGGEDKLVLVKATICCEDRPKLNFDMANAVVLVNGKVIRAEMATVGGRTKAMLIVQLCNQSRGGGGGVREDVLSLTRALKAVIVNHSSAGVAHLPSKPLNNQWSPESSMT